MFGLSLGLAVAFGVYLYGRNPPPAEPAAARAAPPVAEPSAAAAAATPASRPSAAATRAQTAREAEAARFDFYEILPQFEVVVPEVETPQRRSSAPQSQAQAAPARVAEPGSYILQAGSFTSVADADRMQANLALLGIEARIQRVTIDDAVFHRVRVGPISDLQELERIRGRLRDARVDTLLMRMQ